MREHEEVWLGRLQLQRPIGEQRRFPKPGVSDDDHRRSVASHMGIELREVVLPTDEDARTGNGESFVARGFSIERIGSAPFRKQPVDQLGEISEDELSKLLCIAVILAYREWRT